MPRTPRHCCHVHHGRAWCCIYRTWSPPAVDAETAAAHHESTGGWPS
jgi:hypothetical protein